MRILLAAMLALCSSFTLAQAPSAETVFEQTRNALVQVRIIDQASGAKGSIGSGFVATVDGRIVSNYHVISSLTEHPGKYRAEWLDTRGGTGALTLLDFDVVHDLAVLKPTEPRTIAALPIQATPPNKGERVYSLGNPFDLGPTIVEGTFNGLIEKSLYKRMHLTASINPGMSGGPAVAANGEVIGVNVASAGEQIGFLVPAEFVVALLAGDNLAPMTSFNEALDVQLRRNQTAVLKRLDQIGFGESKLGPYRVPGPVGETISCWSDTTQAKKRVIDATTLNCQADDDIFVSDQLRTGSIRYSHSLRRARGISSLRFWSISSGSMGFDFEFMSGGEDEVSNFECRTDTVNHAALKRKVRLCLRRYKAFPSINDLVLRQITLRESDSALASTLVLTGVEGSAAIAFARRFLEQVQ
jgi:serine protease Do